MTEPVICAPLYNMYYCAEFRNTAGPRTFSLFLCGRIHTLNNPSRMCILDMHTSGKSYGLIVVICVTTLFDIQKLPSGLTEFVYQAQIFIKADIFLKGSREARKTMFHSNMGRIRLSISIVNLTYEFSGITHVPPFLSYGRKTFDWAQYLRTVTPYLQQLVPCKSVLMVCSYSVQSNKI